MQTGVSALGVVAVVVAACGPEAKVGTAEVCTSAPSQAIANLNAVAEANEACSTDADCTTIALGGSCFDACTRTVNQAGKGALDRATVPIEAGPCKEFSAAHCEKVVPPCAPPSPPVCKEGRCQ